MMENQQQVKRDLGDFGITLKFRYISKDGREQESEDDSKLSIIYLLKELIYLKSFSFYNISTC